MIGARVIWFLQMTRCLQPVVTETQAGYQNRVEAGFGTTEEINFGGVALEGRSLEMGLHSTRIQMLTGPAATLSG